MSLVVKEIASVLRSTETMAVQFAQRVQEQVDDDVSEAEILDTMRKIPSKRLTMKKVISKIKRRRKK